MLKYIGKIIEAVRERMPINGQLTGYVHVDTFQDPAFPDDFTLHEWLSRRSVLEPWTLSYCRVPNTVH